MLLREYLEISDARRNFDPFAKGCSSRMSTSQPYGKTRPATSTGTARCTAGVITSAALITSVRSRVGLW